MAQGLGMGWNLALEHSTRIELWVQWHYFFFLWIGLGLDDHGHDRISVV